MVPHDRPHVMEGVVGILLSARRMLDAGERHYEGERIHEVQESAWNVGGALRKHVGRQGCPVKGKEMKSSAERLSYRDGVELR